MRRYNNLPAILILALLALVLTGCDREQEVESPISPNSYPIATFATDFSGTSIAEGDTIIYTVTIDKQVDLERVFSAKVIGGTGSDDDFHVTDGTIAPYTNEATIEIVALRDYVADNNSTVELEVGAHDVGSRYEVNPSTVNPVLNLSIDNYIAPQIELTLGWDYTVIVDTSEIHKSKLSSKETTHDNVDFDIFVAEADGYNTSDPWATQVPGVAAATGAHPEMLVFPTLTDGEYVVFGAIWENNLAVLEDFRQTIIGNGDTSTAVYDIEHTLMPFTINVTRQGVYNDKKFVQSEALALSTTVLGENDPGFTGAKYTTSICEVTVSNGEFIVSEYEGDEIVRGKIEDLIISARRPEKLRK